MAPSLQVSCHPGGHSLKCGMRKQEGARVVLHLSAGDAAMQAGLTVLQARGLAAAVAGAGQVLGRSAQVGLVLEGRQAPRCRHQRVRQARPCSRLQQPLECSDIGVALSSWNVDGPDEE